MSELWKTICIGNHLTELPKSSHLSGSSNNLGIYDFYVCSSLKQKSTFYDVHDEAVLLSTGGELAVHLAKGKFAYSSDVWGIRGSDELLSIFLFRWIEYKKEALNHKGFQGSGIKHLDKNYFHKLTIQIPSVKKQQKIAEILTSVDEVIENTQSQIDKLEDLKKATMNELLTKGVGHTEFKETEVGRIPKSWSIVPLAELVVNKGLQTGPFGSQLHAEEYVNEGVPVVMPQDLRRTRISTQRIARVRTSKLNELKRHILTAGDIVFARRGDIGRYALVDEFNEGWVCGTGCLRARPNKEKINPSYLSLYLDLSEVRDWLNLNSVGQTMLNLNTEIIAQLPIKLPTISEQVRISMICNLITATIDRKIEQLSQSHLLKQSLLQDLLTGKVRVKVN